MSIIPVKIPKKYVDKATIMKETVKGYFFEDDVWDMKDKELVKIVGVINNKARVRYINFSIFKDIIKLELKYYLLSNIQKKVHSGLTLIDYSLRFKGLSEFLDKYYPNIYSFSDMNYEKVKIQFTTFLTNKNLQANRSYIALLGVIKYFNAFYDDRGELEKDIWDWRKIPQAKYTENTSTYLLNFTDIPLEFREFVKSYIKSQVISHSLASLSGKVLGLKVFLNYYKEAKPNCNNFIELSRQDIEKFLNWFHFKFPKRSASFVTQRLIPVRGFLLYLQIGEYKQAPKRPVFALFLEGDLPRNNVNKNNVKWIPEKVLNQLKAILDKNPSELNPPMIQTYRERVPIVILLIATGWRISDILNLRYDKCLVQVNNNWYLQGDINKTDVLDHRVPLEDGVVKLIRALTEEVKSKSTELTNPNKFLFPTLSGKRIGQCQRGANVRIALNRWAKDYHIVDDNNEIYKFGNHAFRHTKGVELINSGMNILHIQKWLAHASPEMTLIYARITDQTLRNEWIKANEQSNLFKINIETGNLTEVADEDLIEWEYIKSNLEVAKVPLGYCMASRKMSCPYVETPCLTCNNFCTTPENLPEFEVEINNLNQLIERTKDMPIWNEKNQKRYSNLIEIKEKLQQGHIHHPEGKKAREILK